MTATWMELCLDLNGDADAQAEMIRFWSGALGLVHRRPDRTYEPGDPGELVSPDGSPGWDVALCAVPEARTVKHRVHLDVLTDDVRRLVDAGATIVGEQEHWTVLRDPQGGELCAFVRADPAALPDRRLYEVCVDSADAGVIAAWWAERFEVEVHTRGEGADQFWWLEAVPGMPFDALVFCPVPESKTVKNRIHWDVYGDVREFLDAGARELWRTAEWVVLADPEGNEFCVFPDPAMLLTVPTTT